MKQVNDVSKWSIESAHQIDFVFSFWSCFFWQLWVIFANPLVWGTKVASVFSFRQNRLDPLHCARHWFRPTWNTKTGFQRDLKNNTTIFCRRYTIIIKKGGNKNCLLFFYDKLFIFSGTCWRGANSTVEKRVHCLVKTWTTPLFERVIHPDLEQNEVDSTKCPCSSKCFSLDAGQVFKCDDGADECNSLIAPRNERTHITHGSAIPFFIGERQCVTCFG